MSNHSIPGGVRYAVALRNEKTGEKFSVFPFNGDADDVNEGFTVLGFWKSGRNNQWDHVKYATGKQETEAVTRG